MGLKRGLMLGVVVLLGLIVIPFLIPMGAYQHQAEALVTERLHEKIEIGSLHLAILPSPRVNAGLIRIGAENEISIEKISIVPDILTMLSPVKVVSRIEVEQPVAKYAALAMIKRITTQLDGTSGAAVAVREIKVRGARLDWPDFNLPAVDVALALSEQGLPQMVKITSTDGKIKVDVTPEADGYTIELDAQHWALPFGPAVLFDSLKATMKLHGSQLDVPSIFAKLYRGSLDSTAHLDWGAGWRAGGKFKLTGIDVGEASRLAGKAMRVSGSLSADGTLSSTAKEAGTLADHLVLDSRFNVANGVLYGVDIAKAANLFVHEGQHGGETRFDQLSGNVHAVGKQYDLRNLQVSSGLLAAHGNLKISPTKKLDGRVDVDIKKGVALVTVPLQVSGTVDEPEAMPTKAAMAGAVAGTAVLGPLGTAVGMKAGAALDNLFGSGAKK